MNVSAPCVLCDLVAGSVHSLEFLREPAAVAILSDDWAVRGHAVVVASRHVENLSDLTAAEAAAFLGVARAVEKALLTVCSADRAVLMKLGIAVPHFHLHIYPFRQTAGRPEVMDAIEMRVRDEPGPEAQERMLAALRGELESAEQ